MTLEEILKIKEIEEDIIEVKSQIDVEIKNIRNDSRLVETGSLFVAVKGFNDDGIKYLPQAIEKGAIAALVEEEADIANISIPVIRVRNIKKVVAYISRDLNNNPTKRVPVIAITGSKGKTTTSVILRNILIKKGYNVGLIGTMGAYFNTEYLTEINNTTLESFQTNEMMNEMIKKGANIIILEVSSQAIVGDRVIGMHFEYSTFTNFSRDHISKSEHPTMEAYFDAKVEIANLAPVVVLNMDDNNVKRAKDLLENKKIITYGSSKENDIVIDLEDIHYTKDGTEFSLEYDGHKKTFNTSLPGEIAVYNIACAVAIAKEFNIDEETIQEAIRKVDLIGRFNFIPNELGIDIVIDYAHTEESLKQALLIFRNIAKDKKVISLWGLSGQRDREKRPVMGRISAEYSDITVLTSEDPRDEDPTEISKEIAVGIDKIKGKYIIEDDRRIAIFKAIEMAEPGDIVALLGKGQERTQQFKDKEIPLNEEEIVLEYLRLKKENKIDEILKKESN